MKNWRNRFIGIGMGILLVSSFAMASGENTPRKAGRNKALDIKVTNWGPAQTDIDAAKQRVEQSAAVQDVLKGSKYRLLSFEYIEDGSTKKNLPTPVPTRFRVVFYDYTNDVAVIAESNFAGTETVKVSREPFDPGINGEELAAATKVINDSQEFADLSKNGKLEIYPAMPPVSNLNGERLVNMGIKNLDSEDNQIVGISFKTGKVVHYEGDGPPSARTTTASCGIPTASGGSTGQGVAGQYQLSVSQNGGALWDMLVIRPSSSSGASGERSGIEIRDVKYKGKSVLKRGHAPILNVKYINDTCGPFRDWQYAEGFFNAPAAGATYPNGTSGGIAVLADGQVATTAVETRSDAGNFQGVAIYQQDVGFGKEVVLVTEMNAGWYRYIMEWRFAPDGTIRPRYGFGSTTNGCVCNPRNHHVYWRFDFDIVQPLNNVFQIERGRKFMKPVTTELASFRNPKLNRAFLIQNANGSEAYEVVPGLNDGSVTNAAGVLTDTFGGGDFWIMQFKGTSAAPDELNDPNTSSAANLAPWINGETLSNQDAVVWYSAHQYRVDDASRAEPGAANIINGVHVVGPDLRPVRW